MSGNEFERHFGFVGLVNSGVFTFFCFDRHLLLDGDTRFYKTEREGHGVTFNKFICLG